MSRTRKVIQSSLSALASVVTIGGGVFAMRSLASKEDLKGLASKDDLEAVKDDLQKDMKAAMKPLARGMSGLASSSRLMWSRPEPPPFSLMNAPEFAVWLSNNGFAPHTAAFQSCSAMDVILMPEPELQLRLPIETEREFFKAKIASSAKG